MERKTRDSGGGIHPTRRRRSFFLPHRRFQYFSDDSKTDEEISAEIEYDTDKEDGLGGYDLVHKADKDTKHGAEILNRHQ